MPVKGVCRLRMESVGSCFLQEPKVCSARSVIFADKGEKDISSALRGRGRLELKHIYFWLFGMTE